MKSFSKLKLCKAQRKIVSEKEKAYKRAKKELQEANLQVTLSSKAIKGLRDKIKTVEET